MPLTPFTSTPARVARPTSTVSATSRGRASALPSSAARPNASTPSTSSSPALRSASSARPRAVRRIGDAALDRLAVELEFEAVDRELLRADGEIAARAQQAGLRCAVSGAAFEPGEERFADRSLRSAPAPLKLMPVRRRRHAPAQAHLRETGRAEFERFDVPSVVVELDVAAHVLQRAGRERHRVDADAEPHRERRPIGRGERLDECLERRERQPA